MNARTFALVSLIAAGIASPALAQGLSLSASVEDRELLIGQSTTVAVRVLQNGWPVPFEARNIQLSSPGGLAAFTALSRGRNEVTFFRMDAIRPGSCRVVATAFLRTGGFIQASVPFVVFEAAPRPAPRDPWSGGRRGGWDHHDDHAEHDDHDDHDDHGHGHGDHHHAPAPVPTRWVQFGDPQRIPDWASSKNYFDFTFDNPSGTIEVALQIRIVLNGGSGTADVVRLEFADGSSHDLVTRAPIGSGQGLVIDVPAWAQNKKIHRVFTRMRGPRGAETVCHVLTRAH